jgi:hypothetical protein
VAGDGVPSLSLSLLSSSLSRGWGVGGIRLFRLPFDDGVVVNVAPLDGVLPSFDLKPQTNPSVNRSSLTITTITSKQSKLVPTLLHQGLDN